MPFPTQTAASAVAACCTVCGALAYDAPEPASNAQAAATQHVVISAKREHRASTGATGLALSIKETPQTISTVEQQDMRRFGAAGSNEALALGTGLHVEQYETNRAVFQSRGFDVQLTQVDGLGVLNEWGTILGQQDTALFERIELIRGANGLLTGVGNASGTINYVRKRPKSADGGLLSLTAGTQGLMRGLLDANRVLSDDGRWAARAVAAYDDRGSHVRDLRTRRSALYAVVDGQIGDDGQLTLGLTSQASRQAHAMWGTPPMQRADGSRVDWDLSVSTAQRWTYWNTQAQTGFVEYAHALNADWEAKATWLQSRSQEDAKLLYAFAPAGGLNADGTGLVSWPYHGGTHTRSRVLDAHVSGSVDAAGRRHSLIVGISHTTSHVLSNVYPYDESRYKFQPLPAFPFGGDAFAEPQWGAVGHDARGLSVLTRLYAASHLALTDATKLVLGLNAVHLRREGAALYGTAQDANDYPVTRKASPYVGITHDVTPDTLVYLSYSDIFQNQSQADRQGAYLPPTRGINWEAGIKHTALDGRLLTTAAVFTAEQRGLATFAGVTDAGGWYYAPQDMRSEGVEMEVKGPVSPAVRIAAGVARVLLEAPQGQPTAPWLPRTTANLRLDAGVPSVPGLEAGLGVRWQSATRSDAGLAQGSYALAQAYLSYAISSATTLRLNVDNLTGKRHLTGLLYGGMYGAPRSAALTLEYTL